MVGVFGQGGDLGLFGRRRFGFGTGAGAAAGVDLDDVAFDGDAAGIDFDEAARGLDGQFLVGFEDDAFGLGIAFVADGGALVGADDQFVGATDLGGARGLDKELQAAFDPAVDLADDLPNEVAAGVEVAVAFNAIALVLADGLVAVLVDVFVFVIVDAQVTVVADPFLAVVFQDDVVVFLAVQVGLLFVVFVFETQFVVAGAAVGLGFDGHPRLVLGKTIRRQVVGVVAAPGDDGLIGVALNKIDDDFVADARDGHVAPGSAGPVLGDADPATGGVVALGVAVPGELHRDASVVVAEQFFAGRADDISDLRAVDDGFGPGGRGELLRKGDGLGLEFEVAGVFGLDFAAAVEGHLGFFVAGLGLFDDELVLDRDPGLVAVFFGVVFEFETQAFLDVQVVVSEGGDALFVLGLLLVVLGEGFALFVFFVAAVVAVGFVAAFVLVFDVQAVVGVFEVVVGVVEAG